MIKNYKNRLFQENYSVEYEMEIIAIVGGDSAKRTYRYRFLELKKCFIDMKIQIINAIFFS